MKTFTYDSVSSDTYGLFINGRGVFDSPEPDLEFLTVPGRSGDLVYDNKRFGNIEIKYPACFMLDSFQTNFKSFQAFLLSHKGYYKLTDDYQSGYYRMAAINKAIKASDIDWTYNAGSFDLVFNCKPQLFLTSGDTMTTITSASYTLNNPTKFASKPLLRVTGTGSVTVNGVTITVASHSYAYVDIDCELMDCYYQGYNLNDKVTIGDYFPQLDPGNNAIALSGVTSLGVTPRWWTV